MNLEVLKHKFATTERLRYLVDNEWRTSKTAKYMPVMNPITGEQIAEAPCCTAGRSRQRRRRGRAGLSRLARHADPHPHPADVPLQAVARRSISTS